MKVKVWLLLFLLPIVGLLGLTSTALLNQWLWNWSIVSIFGLNNLDYWQSIKIVCYFAFLLSCSIGVTSIVK